MSTAVDTSAELSVEQFKRDFLDSLRAVRGVDLDAIGAAVEVGVPTAVTWHCMLDRSRPLFRALGHARRWREAGAALSAVSRPAADRVVPNTNGTSQVWGVLSTPPSTGVRQSNR